MAHFRSIDPQTVGDESSFRNLMDKANESTNRGAKRDGLLGLLEKDGLTRNMSVRAMGSLRTQMDFDSGMTEERVERTFRICLRFIALHYTSMPFSEETVADISCCLDAAVFFADEDMFPEIIDNEYVLPFIFDAVRTTRDKENKRDVIWLACSLFSILPPSLRVTVLVRYYALLPDIFMRCYGEGERAAYAILGIPEYAGILATMPSLIDMLIRKVKRDVLDIDAGYALDQLLATALTDPSLLEHLLGFGVLNAVASFYANTPGHVRLATEAATTIRAVLSAHPEWTQTVKRIADSATVENAVVEMGQALPSRAAREGVDYNLL